MKRIRKITILGAPGAGKGTLIQKLGLNIPTISTSASLRAAAESSDKSSFFQDKDEGAINLKELMSSGQLVPNEIVQNVMKERLNKDDCKNGYLLDGFPRTLEQAKFMDENNLGLDLAILLDTKSETIIERMSGRRTCPTCGAVYNVNTDQKPKVDGKCDKCGADLIQRKDDDPEIVKKRLSVYDKDTRPVVDYYQKKGILKTIDGSKSLPDMVKDVLSLVNP
jgi:adenylate kinase